MKRSWLFTLILLAIAAVEGLVVFYDLTRPNQNIFPLAMAEVVVPKRVIEIKPFVFEQPKSAEMLRRLEVLKHQAAEPLLKKIVVQSSEPEATEKAPVDENIAEEVKQSEAVLPKLKNNEGGPVMVAVVIDDMGVSVPHTKDILSLEKPITASFLTYGAANRKQVQEAKDKGFEVMLHVPMMPHAKADLAPVTLSPQMDEVEIKNDLIKMLNRYDGMGMKGINNHMGSLFTEDEKSMNFVMQVLKSRGMFFLDSKTTSKSAAEKAAAAYGVPYIARDVFLDNENDYDYVMKQLRQTEKIAHMRGYAVAIGHPRTQTYKALRDWMKELPERRIRLVRLQDLVREVNKKS